jgi:type II secretory pathway pseudopilin PulG
MNFSKKVKKISEKKTAYSLIELSVVIIIMSIMVSSGLSLVTSSSNNSRIQLTKERMNVIYKALGAYLINHKSLPCPAPINAIKSSDSTYGDATGVDGDCTTAGVATRGAGLVYGMIPTQDLNLDSSFAEDGFGSKFTYVVAQAFTDPDVATGFATSAETDIITIKDKVSPSAEQITTPDAIFVLMSHGVNRFGAYSNNADIANSGSTDAEEQINHGATNNFFATSNTSDIFDDILIFKTRDELVAELEEYSLVACKAGGNQTLYGVDYTWPLSRYDENVAADQECPTSPTNYKVKNARPIKRCGAFGVWESDPSTPCHDF